MVVGEKGQDSKYALAVGTIEDFSVGNLLVVLPMAWIETKLLVNDYLSIGILFFLAPAPLVAALVIMKKRSYRSVSEI